MKDSVLSTLYSTLQQERPRFVLWVPVLLGVGIGVYFSLPQEPSLDRPMRLLALLMAMLLFTRRRYAARIACIACIIANLGFFGAYMRTHAINNPVYSGEPVMRSVRGTIDDIQIRETGQKLILRAPMIEGLLPDETPQRISISLRKEYPHLQVGNEVEALAMLFPPPGPAMPGAYDFARAFYFDRIGAVGFAPSEPRVTDKGEISDFASWLTGVRLSLAQRIMRQMDEDSGPVAAAMMVGEQTAVSEEVGDALRDAGLYHVLSISGLHLSIAAGLLYFTTRFLLALRPSLAMRLPAKKIAAGIGLAGSFAYLMLAGYPVPAIRSFVMVACVMLAVLVDRRGISLYSLGWAAVIILLWQPEALMGASFQLSFAATIAILAFYERFGHVVVDSTAGPLRKTGLYFLGLMLTSLVATLATTPLVIYHFNRFTLWGIAANMLMMPLASFWIMPLAVLSFIAMPLRLEHAPLVALDWGIGLMIAGSRWIAGFPLAALALPSPAATGIVLCVVGGLWLCLWQARWRLLGIPLIIGGMATMALHKPYDLLASGDGKRVAVRLQTGELLFLRGRVDSFDAEVWLRAQGQEQGLVPKDMQGRADAPQCDQHTCRATLHGYRVAVSRMKKAAVDLCDKDVDIVIAQEQLGGQACASVPLVIDGTFLRANGAVALRLAGDIQIDLAQELRGRRPWTPR